MFGKSKKEDKMHDDDITPEEQAYVDSIKGQNPYGMITFLMGGLCYFVGYIYVFIPIITIIFGIFTYRTFDREREDNPWTFYIGILLAVTGIYMFIRHEAPPLPF
ncbi:cell division protein FtsK [Bacillus sp. BRMEA1]|uniref:cell division protein FtsK n=1 Tax=Neobacillus endophyticus TaxID=2738405 RepID=UPI0015644E08|nr:cell division protein FtsK [Neobacillus endophyticus]NRD77883.1 cell division protein FtsK [Neobacillus endophyticus]